MASFVYAVWSITNVASVHCAVRPEISPCTCEPIYAHNYVELSCEKVDSFHQIVDVLSNKFEPTVNISLKISHSQLDDLEMRSFTDMNLNLVKLRLQWNGLRSVPELPFRGLSNLEFLSVGDNELEEIPKHMLNHMPVVKTLDMGRCRLRSILHDDLKGTQMVTNLFFPSNNITRLDKGAFPPNLVTLHLGRNQIENLNGTLRDLNKLESLFINMNSISSLDNELPESNRLKLIIAQNNRLERLPESMRYMNKLETLHVQNNRLKTLDGMFKHAKYLTQFYAYNNEIESLAQDEFQSSDRVEEFEFAFNKIKSLNYSLLPLSTLSHANFSHNEIEEFSMNEIRGLKRLKHLDLSNNHIKKLTGRQENNIDQDSFLIQFDLDHNQLTSLDGALMGLNSLRILGLSFNKIERILPEDFIGLVKLEILELSHNHLLTLKEMETTYLPSLKVLKVAYNNLTKLERDFHGLPVLCQANLTNNQISSISMELVSETRCMNHNVPGKLELHLEDNPIMCDEHLNELCPIMLVQETRIRGRSQCYESANEVCTALSMMLRPAILPANLPIFIQQQLAANGRVVPQIVPTPILVPAQLNDDLLPPLIASLAQPIIKPLAIITTTTTTTSTTTTTTTPSPPTTTTTTTERPTATTTAAATGTTTTTSNPIRIANEMAMAHYIGQNDRTNDYITNGNATTATITLLPTTPPLHTPVAIASNEASSPTTAMKVEAPPLVLDIEEAHLSTGHAAAAPHLYPAPQRAATATGSNDTPTVTAADGTAIQLNSHAQVPALQPEYATLEYIPNLDEFMTGSRSSDALEEDSKTNSVHEEFPSVVLANLDNDPQSLLIPEEPPESP